tara:strand:- start:225 stop:779 length:555 start_codon:yes stop_codon:yes gene_type:complete
MCNSCGDDTHVVKEEFSSDVWVKGYDNWKKVLKNLRPETIIRPDEKDRSRSDDLSWIAPIDAVDLKDEQDVRTKTADCPECEFITDGSMEDRRKSKENPNYPGKCKECAEYWCSVPYNDRYSDSGMCGFRVCEKHWKKMTKNGRITDTVGGHRFTGDYDTTRRQSDYDEDGQFNEDRYNRRNRR